MKTRKTVDRNRWVHVSKGVYRTRCGRGLITQVAPNDWAAHVGPSGQSQKVGNGQTAAIASHFVEQVLDSKG